MLLSKDIKHGLELEEVDALGESNPLAVLLYLVVVALATTVLLGFH